MKRLFFASILVAALVVPSIAPAATGDYSSSAAKRGFNSLDFTVFTNANGKPKAVGEISATDVQADCDEGAISIDVSNIGTASSGPNGPAKVQNKEFSKKYDTNNGGGGTGTFQISGEFKNHNEKIKGSFRVKGDFPINSRTNCDSGKKEYTAT